MGFLFTSLSAFSQVFFATEFLKEAMLLLKFWCCAQRSVRVLTINWDRRIEFGSSFIVKSFRKKNPIAQWDFFYFVECFFSQVFFATEFLKEAMLLLKILMLRSTISEKVLTINWDRRIEFGSSLSSKLSRKKKSHCSMGFLLLVECFFPGIYDRIFKRSNASLKFWCCASTISEKVLTINWDRRIEFGSSLSSKFSFRKKIPLLNGISFTSVECFSQVFCDRIFGWSKCFF